MSRLLVRVTALLLPLITIIMVAIHTRPFDDNTIRTILRPSDCNAPCFIGIRPGITRMPEAQKLLESHPWVGQIHSRLDSGCCTIALSWRWNGQQPDMFGNNENTVYFSYDPHTGEQIVQNIAIHTRIPAGDAILTLGKWPLADSGALQGLNTAYVEVFYREQAVHLSMDVGCPLNRWQLWQAPVTLALNHSADDLTGMQPINRVC